MLHDGREVTLRVRINPRARRISLRLDPATQDVVAVAPSDHHTEEALAFARSRRSWVSAQLARMPKTIRLEPGLAIPVRGVDRRLEWVQARTAPFLAADALYAGAPDPALFAARVRRFLHAEARKDLVERVRVHAEALGVRPSRISVKDTTSRWGSCTADGALSFSWRVILAPSFVLDYLAAHEVAHLREMNHSPRFWRLVAQCIPDFGHAEGWLDRHGPSLHAIDPKG